MANLIFKLEKQQMLYLKDDYKLSLFLDCNNRVEQICQMYYDSLKELKDSLKDGSKGNFKLLDRQSNHLEKYSKLIIKNINLKVNVLDNKLYIYTILNEKFIKIASIFIINNKLCIDIFGDWFFNADALNNFLNDTLNITINQDLIDLLYANILANSFIK